MSKKSACKNALITGASRGIGHAIARHFAEQGYDLYLIARTAATLDDVAATFRHRFPNINVYAVAVDLADSNAVAAALAPWQKQLSDLHVLVNCAGIFRFGSSQLSIADLQAMLTTNVVASHQLCTLFRPALIANGHAHIFNVSSIAGVEGFAPIAGYAASKHALLGYGDSLAKECLRDNIAVTTLCPDVVNTDMSAPSGMPPEHMIQSQDLCEVIAMIMRLSSSALIDRVVIKCKTLVEMSNVRQ